MQISELVKRAVNEILPKSCVFCGVLSERDEIAICAGCRDDLPWRASAPSAPPFEVCVAPLAYEFPIDAAIKLLKFKRKLFYLPAFTEILQAASTNLPDDIDAVLPVPLHWRRRVFRGFNQALEIAKPIARSLDVPVIDNVYRRKSTAYQTGLAATAREKNLQRAFAVRGKLAYEHVLIVDDVITTAATARSLARILLMHGVSRVSAVAIAKA